MFCYRLACPARSAASNSPMERCPFGFPLMCPFSATASRSPGRAIQSDADEHPDILAVGDVKLILLKRGTRYALRMKDNQSPLRASFAGLRWYPPSEDWRIQAKFVPSPRQIQASDGHNCRRE